MGEAYIIFQACLKIHKNKMNVQKYLSHASVYVHYPFCEAICTYCNFNKYKLPVKDAADNSSAFTKLLIKELEFKLKNSTIESITSVYFGGGTPSLAKACMVSSILN